jgi:hypothetical protein
VQYGSTSSTSGVTTYLSAAAYYLPVFLQENVRFPPSTSLILPAYAAVQFFIVSLPVDWRIEQLGRRTWWIWSSVFQRPTMVQIVI